MDRAILIIDCDNNTLELENAEIEDLEKLEFPICEKKSKYVGRLIMLKSGEYMKKTKEELMQEYLECIKAS